ncbi:L-seryl-tRNA(Sec) selenium transferase [Thioalkalivibrio denitrificans]|uniref:L-seryl-tRNA(Sec) selenium transferase n=2 Tax=Thioalkalivibrio denitrificans TaxID=108003 RepID=A0A1V3NRI5_9GAMM|nr:L-seryl-tRNA(Sec) selenium transferase [Thioalkalivibrio denitrificans]
MAESMTRDGAAALPAVYEVLGQRAVIRLLEHTDHQVVVAEIRAALARHRGVLLANGTPPPDAAAVAAEVAGRLSAFRQPALRKVINLTGTLLHTNLGRSPLSREAKAAVATAAATTNLEYDLDTGRRGDRDNLVSRLLTRLSGAPAATVVNNNAAALWLTLNTLAPGRGVVISRGELVEIGDSFRMPDIITASGCRLMEVGTTNRTHLRDYENALDAGGSVLLKVHTSNYRIEGFTREVPLEQLVELGRRRGVPVVADLGSGALVDLACYGLPGEPTVQETVRAGADVVTFSGDKLLGGPQAGLIVGSRDHLQAIRRNPVRRALRCDKLRLAALEATLRAYLDPRSLSAALPAYRILGRSRETVERIARRMMPFIAEWAGDVARVEIVTGESQVGSGAQPCAGLPTALVALTPRDADAGALAHALRRLTPPVIGRVHKGRVLLDMRALLEPAALIAALRGVTR